MTPHGNVGAVTWRNLIWHYDYPSFSASANLCDYSVGNGKANWATGAAIGQLEAASKAFAATPPGPRLRRRRQLRARRQHPASTRPTRSASTSTSGPIRDAGEPVHVGHELAVRVVRPGRHPDPDQDDPGGRPGHVKLIYFNDPVLIREGLTTWYSGHDDHLHIRYCEPSYPIARYRC